MSNFKPIEVVGRGSESQLQVGKNLNNQLSMIRVSKIIHAGDCN